MCVLRHCRPVVLDQRTIVVGIRSFSEYIYITWNRCRVGMTCAQEQSRLIAYKRARRLRAVILRLCIGIGRIPRSCSVGTSVCVHTRVFIQNYCSYYGIFEKAVDVESLNEWKSRLPAAGPSPPPSWRMRCGGETYRQKSRRRVATGRVK